MRSLLAALAFLTRLPVPGGAAAGAVGRAAGAYPAAGYLIGWIAALTWLLAAPWPDALRALAVVAAAVWVTGGLHVDGWVDTFDGLHAGHDAQKALDAMGDPRVGALGAVWGVLLLAGKWAALLELGASLLWALPVAAATGRFAMVVAAARHPCARPTGGLGDAFKRGIGRRQVAVAAGSWLAVLALQAALLGPGGGWAAALATARAAAAGLVLALGLAAGVARRLGGLTGDVYGAVNELAELACLWVALA